MNYSYVIHVPVEDLEDYKCSGCDKVCTDDEYKESQDLGYEEPRCKNCVAKDEIKMEEYDVL